MVVSYLVKKIKRPKYLTSVNSSGTFGSSFENNKHEIQHKMIHSIHFTGKTVMSMFFFFWRFLDAVYTHRQGRIRFCALILDFDEIYIFNGKCTINSFKMRYYWPKIRNMSPKYAKNLIFRQNIE